MTVGSDAGSPRTQEGKEIVRWNATRHGIRSPAPVVPGVDTNEDWEEHRDGILESLSPEGHLEMVLVERVALLSCRLHRVTRYETESIALSWKRARTTWQTRGVSPAACSGRTTPKMCETT